MNIPMKKQFLISLILVSLVLTISAQQIPVAGDGYHFYGPNTSWGQYLQVGGNGRVTTNASVFASNGNLHIDSKDGFGIYLNYFGFGNTYINPRGGVIGVGTDAPDPNCGMHMYQNRYTLYGPNTTWGQYLQVGGNGR